MNPPIRRRAGFTLIEILVVIGIITLLVAVALPLIGASLRSAKAMKTRADLGTIAQALVEYKKDHNGQYPQVPGGDLSIGFAVLAKELAGTYGDGFLPGSTASAPDDPNDPPAWNSTTEYKAGDSVGGISGPFYTAMSDNVGQATGTKEVWADWGGGTPRDGVDGPGARLNGGRKLPPYLANFKVRGCALIDGEGKPILYFPSHGSFNINQAGTGTPPVPSPYVSQNGPSKFEVGNNIGFFIRMGETVSADGGVATNRVRAMLGDLGTNGAWPPNGVIETGAMPAEVARETGGFILWAAGPDGFYGPWWNPNKRPNNDPITASDVAKCDDLLLSQ